MTHIEQHLHTMSGDGQPNERDFLSFLGGGLGLFLLHGVQFHNHSIMCKNAHSAELFPLRILFMAFLRRWCLCYAAYALHKSIHNPPMVVKAWPQTKKKKSGEKTNSLRT